MNFMKMDYGKKCSRMDPVKFVKTAFKKSEGVSSALGRPYPLQLFKRLSITNFTWSILEYFVPDVHDCITASFQLILSNTNDGETSLVILRKATFP